MTARDIDVESRRALSDFLYEVSIWGDAWDKGSDDRESLALQGFILVAHLNRMRRNTLTSAAHKQLNARLETSQASFDPQDMFSTAIRRLQAEAERFDAEGDSIPQARDILRGILDGTALVSEHLPQAGSAVMLAVKVVDRHRHLLSDAVEMARSWRFTYRCDAELPLHLILTAVIEGNEELTNPRRLFEEAGFIPPSPQAPEAEPPNLPFTSSPDIDDTDLDQETNGPYRMAASTSGPASSAKEAERELWLRWHLVAGRPEACRDLLETLSDELNLDEKTVLCRRVREELPAEPKPVCWLLFSLPGSDGRFWPAVAWQCDIQPSTHDAALTRIGGLNADARFCKSARRALTLAGNDLDGAPWDVTGLERVPQAWPEHVLVGGSAGVAIYAHACWARRGVRPSLPIAFTGEITASGVVQSVRDVEVKVDAALRAQLEWVVAPGTGDTAHVDRASRILWLPQGVKADRWLATAEHSLATEGVVLVPEVERWERWLEQAETLLFRRELDRSAALLCKLEDLAMNINVLSSSSWWDLIVFRIAANRAANRLHIGDPIGARAGLSSALQQWETCNLRPSVVQKRWLFGLLTQCAIDLGEQILPSGIAAVVTSMATAIDDDELDDEAKLHASGSWAEWMQYQGILATSAAVRDAHFLAAERVLIQKAKIERTLLRQRSAEEPLVLRAHGQLAQLYTFWERYDDAWGVLEPIFQISGSELTRMLSGTTSGNHDQTVTNWRFQAVYALRLLGLEALKGDRSPSAHQVTWMHRVTTRLRDMCARDELHLLAVIERSLMVLGKTAGSPEGPWLEDCWLRLVRLAESQPQQGQLVAWGLAASMASWFGAYRDCAVESHTAWLGRAEQIATGALSTWFGRVDSMRQLTEELREVAPGDDLHHWFRRIMSITLY